MRLAGVTAVVVAALVAAGCGLGLGGLEDVASARDAGSGADVEAATDGTVGDDGGEPEAADEAGDPDTGSTVDAVAEGSTPDAPTPPVDAGCAGVVCNGACTTASTCAGCGGANLLCAATNTCTSDCTACAGSPIQCFACDVNRMNPIGTCQPDDPTSYCLDTSYAGAYAGGPGYHCGCTFATDCPGDDQVCIAVGPATTTFGCFTCGEAYTGGFSCKSGNGSAKCDAMKATCH